MSVTRVDGRSVRFQHRRAELLSGAAEYILANGLNGLSLRPVAKDLGITHASLLRHFSSKDDLVDEVLDLIREDLLARLDDDPEVAAAPTFADRTRAVWRVLCEPKEQRQFLLLFELVGDRRARPGAAEALARSIVEGWIEPSVAQLESEGWNVDDARAAAAVTLAQIRGLQLDLILTRDRARVDRAMEIGLSALTSHGPAPTSR